MDRVDSRGAMAGVVADLRLLVVGTVVALTPWQPDFALRTGAAVCGVVLVVSVRGLRVRRADVYAVLYAVLALTSTVWAVDADVTDLGVKNTIACVVLFLTVRAVVRRPRDLRGIAAALVIGCGIGLYRLWQANPTGRQLRLQYDSAAARVGIEGLNYNALAYAFATGAAAVVLLWATSGPTRRRRATLLSAVAVLAMWVGVLLSGTRGAVVGIVVMLAWLFVTRFAPPQKAFRWLVAAVIMANVLVFSGWADGLLRSTSASSGRETGDLNGRLRIWPFARDAFWDHPFIGHGVDGVIALYGNPLRIAAHNALLDVGVGLGLVGIVLFVATLWTALAQTTEWTSPTRYVVVGAFVAVTAPIMLSGYWSEAPVFWIALGLFSSLGVLEGRSGLEPLDELVELDVLHAPRSSPLEA